MSVTWNTTAETITWTAVSDPSVTWTVQLDATITGGSGAVDSVNGETGTVVLDAADVGALPDDTVVGTLMQTIVVVSGDVTVATLEAVIVGTYTAGTRFALGYASMLTTGSGVLGVYPSGTVTGGSGDGVYLFNGTTLTFENVVSSMTHYTCSPTVIDEDGATVGALSPAGAMFVTLDLGAGDELVLATVAQPSTAVSVAASGFTGNLTTSATTTQAALEEIDALSLGGGTLADLTDTDVTTDPPAQDDVLAWDATGSKWTPATLDGGVSLADGDPEDLGTAAPGVAETASRSDHVHGMPSAADVGAAAASHNHAAADVTSGAFDAARLATGTATDGYVIASNAGTPTWTAAAGGGSGITTDAGRSLFAGTGYQFPYTNTQVSGSSQTTVQDFLYPNTYFIPLRDMTISALSVRSAANGSAGSVIRMGIFSLAALDIEGEHTLVSDCGTTPLDVGVTSQLAITGLSVALTAGIPYCFVFTHNSTSSVSMSHFRGAPIQGAIGDFTANAFALTANKAQAYGALPATFTPGTVTTTTTPGFRNYVAARWT